MGSLSESVVSFFKVMIDDDFSRLLYLPPKFARTAPHLLNKKTYLENLNGRRWNVVVSKENGSLAFRKGWSQFSIAHNLEIGDLVVFHYFVGQYFTVQIFNRSACDVRGLGVGNGSSSKRRRHETKPVDTDFSLHATNQNSAGKQDSHGKEDSNGSLISADRGNVHIPENKSATEVPPLAIVPVENNTKRKAEPAKFEDPEVQFLMIGRGALNEQRDNRTVIDLSSYEMPSADAESNRQRAVTGWSLPCADNVVKCKAEPELTEFANLKQEMKYHVGFPESTKGKEVDRSLYSEAKPKLYDGLTVGSPRSPDLSPMHGPRVRKLNAPKKGYRAEKPDAAFQSGKAAVKIKKEIKTEPFEEAGLSLVTASASDLHCPITSASSLFLELPGSLPLFTSRPRASDSKLVILRDAAERVWPVFYYHKPTMKILTTGWSEFWKANNIRPGDECIFKAETEADATYDVSIVRQEDNKPT